MTLVVLMQMALEILSWAVLVEETSTLTPHQFRARSHTAEEKIRELPQMGVGSHCHPISILSAQRVCDEHPREG